jgi:succinate dehydrogenase / fumarate reductase cytochrome b subunit
VEAAHAPSATPDKTSFFARNEFLIRRLHSLSGPIPVGAYMVVHLLTNSTVNFGGWFFQQQVDMIHMLGPALPFVEWTFIFIPLLFHGIVGLVIIKSGTSNAANYPYGKNIRYTLQRVTGMIAFVFIMMHVLHMHHLGSFLGNGFAAFDPHHAAESAQDALSSFWVQLFYAIGVLSSVFHLANGLWTMGITWGVWVSPAAQKRADYVCMAFGVALAAVSMFALYGMTRVDPKTLAKPDGSGAHAQQEPAEGTAPKAASNAGDQTAR